MIHFLSIKLKDSNTGSMCINATKERCKVVVAGAGPAGLLCCALLLARNNDSTAEGSSVVYDVTLIDNRQDLGSLSQEELSKSFRSWMLGLTNHGLDAIREVPNLYHNYVKGEGVQLDEFNIYFGSKEMKQKSDDEEDVDNFIVDRNFIVAAIARYLKETHENDENFHSMYLSSCQYVDYENKQVLVRNVKSKDETYVPYDLLIGCDGVRSVVREALIRRHSDFACSVSDIFQKFKAVHIQRPTSVSARGMSILPNCFKNFQGIVLPETGDNVNISIGVPHNLFDDIDPELKSEDYKIVSQYLKENFKAFELVDYDDFAKQWVGQRWNKTGQVHCNRYHSSQMNIVIMGDAAHATSPSIGMGMNTALRDAQIFNQLLKENKDDINATLPAFSEARVKEGNSLTSLAFNLNCLDNKAQTLETIHMVVRMMLHKRVPWLVSNHPQAMIGRRGVGLSDVFDHATKLGIISKQRAINEKVCHEYFEQTSGMVAPTKKSKRGSILYVSAAIAVLSSVVVMKTI